MWFPNSSASSKNPRPKPQPTPTIQVGRSWKRMALAVGAQARRARIAPVERRAVMGRTVAPENRHRPSRVGRNHSTGGGKLTQALRWHLVLDSPVRLQPELGSRAGTRAGYEPVLANAQSSASRPPAAAPRRRRCRTWGPTHSLPVLRLAAALFALASVGTSRAEPAQHPVNFSFFYPLSTNRDPMVETHFRLGILYGRVGAIHGVDLSGVVGRIHGDMSGLQVNGVAAVN